MNGVGRSKESYLTLHDDTRTDTETLPQRTNLIIPFHSNPNPKPSMGVRTESIRYLSAEAAVTLVYSR